MIIIGITNRISYHCITIVDLINLQTYIVVTILARSIVCDSGIEYYIFEFFK